MLVQVLACETGSHSVLYTNSARSTTNITMFFSRNFLGYANVAACYQNLLDDLLLTHNFVKLKYMVLLKLCITGLLVLLSLKSRVVCYYLEYWSNGKMMAEIKKHDGKSAKAACKKQNIDWNRICVQSYPTLWGWHRSDDSISWSRPKY